jgi:hypothetical protein
VIYERLGTKGLLLHEGRIVRELDRSYYHASAYEYPVALFNDPDGRVLLAHCLGNYCRLELEEAETGRPLTASADRKPSDFSIRGWQRALMESGCSAPGGYGIR